MGPFLGASCCNRRVRRVVLSSQEPGGRRRRSEQTTVFHVQSQSWLSTPLQHLSLHRTRPGIFALGRGEVVLIGRLWKLHVSGSEKAGREVVEEFQRRRSRRPREQGRGNRQDERSERERWRWQRTEERKGKGQRKTWGRGDRPQESRCPAKEAKEGQRQHAARTRRHPGGRGWQERSKGQEDEQWKFKEPKLVNQQYVQQCAKKGWGFESKSKEAQGRRIGGFKRRYLEELCGDAGPSSEDSDGETIDILRQQGEEGERPGEMHRPDQEFEQEVKDKRIPFQILGAEPEEEEKETRRKQPELRRWQPWEEEEKEEREEEEEKEERQEESEEEESDDGEWANRELERLFIQFESEQQIRGLGSGIGATLEEEVTRESGQHISSIGGSCPFAVGARGRTRPAIGEDEEGAAEWDPYLDISQRSASAPVPDSSSRSQRTTPFSSCHGQFASRCLGKSRRHPGRKIHSAAPVNTGLRVGWCATPGSRATTGEQRLVRRASFEGQKTRQDGAQGARSRKLGPRQRTWQRRKELRLECLGSRKRALAEPKGKGERKERRKERQEGFGGSKERVEGEPREGRQVIEADVRTPERRLASAVPGEKGEKCLQGLIGERGLEVWWHAFEKVHDLATLGCVLAWLSTVCPLLPPDANSQRFLRSVFEKVAGSHGPLARTKGAVFPVALGNLGPVRAVLINSSLNEVVQVQFVEQWKSEAWLLIACLGLNGMTVGPRPLVKGPWTAAQERGLLSMRHSVERFLALGGRGSWSVETVSSELKEKRVSYSGEELATVHPLTVEQVVAALPPLEHSGMIPLVNFLLPGTRELVEHPERLLIDELSDDLPPLQAKIHCSKDQILPLAMELVRRNICGWTEWSEVYEIKGQKVLSGMFGIEKSTKLSDGRNALRLIMNLIPSNSVMKTICGRVRGLPSITSWMSVITLDTEEIRSWQSDMCSAFYLFSVPPSWAKFLSFNLRVNGSLIGKDSQKDYALSCKVLPMGWSSSVALMQEVAEQLVLREGFEEGDQIAKGAPLPHFLVEALQQGAKEGRPWWHCYLDNFCIGQKVRPGTESSRGSELHRKAEGAWKKAGIVSSEKKRVVAASEVQELGACLDGKNNTVGVSGERFLKVAVATMFVIGSRRMERKLLQIIGGRWVHILQFRRPGMACLQNLWKMISPQPHGTELPFMVRRELVSLLFLMPLLHTSLSSPRLNVVTASDASLRGGAVGIARELTPAGKNFVGACRAAGLSPGKVPIFVVSLFNGIGGCFRIYDVLGIQILGGVAIDLYGPANRISSRRWPVIKILKDVREINQEICDTWALEFTDALEVHLWAGFPCTDLSSAKAGREGLSGTASSLFYEIPRIEALLQRSFGKKVKIKKTIENVSSMERSECDTISRELALFPYLLDCSDAVPWLGLPVRSRRAPNNMRMWGAACLVIPSLFTPSSSLVRPWHKIICRRSTTSTFAEEWEWPRGSDCRFALRHHFFGGFPMEWLEMWLIVKLDTLMLSS